MNIDDITRVTDAYIDLSPRLWAWASLLGEARTASNDVRRHRRSDRGGFNSQVDLLGALGELFLLDTVMRASSSDEAVAHMRDHLYRDAGGRGVKGPDLRFVDDAGRGLCEIDVKTFDCSPNKRFFAINGNKHRSLGGECSDYLCIVAPPHGRRMAVARLVPYADVERWPEVSLRWNGSPSRNCRLPDFLRWYFSKAPDVDALRGDVYAPQDIDKLKADPAVRAGLMELVPSLAL